MLASHGMIPGTIMVQLVGTVYNKVVNGSDKPVTPCAIVHALLSHDYGVVYRYVWDTSTKCEKHVAKP